MCYIKQIQRIVELRQTLTLPHRITPTNVRHFLGVMSMCIRYVLFLLGLRDRRIQRFRL